MSFVHRRVGKAGQIDLDDVSRALGIDYQTYVRAARWAQRNGYLDEPSVEQYSIENGGVYITEKGMNAVDENFAKPSMVGGPAVNISDSKVYGTVIAAGRDAMVVGHPMLASETDEIRRLLAGIQNAIETLPEESDERYDALKEVGTIEREFEKESPSLERIERSVNVLGSIASIATPLAPYVPALLQLAQQSLGG